MYTMYLWSVSTESDTEHLSEHYTRIPNDAAYVRDPMLNMTPTHTATMAIPHTSKLYEINLVRSNNLAGG